MEHALNPVYQKTGPSILSCMRKYRLEVTVSLNWITRQIKTKSFPVACGFNRQHIYIYKPLRNSIRPGFHFRRIYIYLIDHEDDLPFEQTSFYSSYQTVSERIFYHLLFTQLCKWLRGLAPGCLTLCDVRNYCPHHYILHSNGLYQEEQLINQ